MAKPKKTHSNDQYHEMDHHFLCIASIGLVQAQTTLSEKYAKADELVQAKEYKNAYSILKREVKVGF